MSPARTSPEPAVARSGSANGDRHAPPGGAAMTVRAPFEHDDLTPVRRGGGGCRGSFVVTRRLAARQAGELAGVRCQDAGPSERPPPAGHGRERGERAGIDHGGPAVRRQDQADDTRRRAIRREPGPDDERVVGLVGDRRCRSDRVDLPGGDLGEPARDELGHAPRDEGLERGGHEERREACPTAQGGGPDEERRTRVVE